VLAHLFPQADVPVVQLSLHGGKDAAYHFDLGARLAPLRDRGILIVGSGNVVHNLRRVQWGSDDGFDWCERFDGEVKRIMESDPGALPGVTAHPDYALAVPTPEHFLPLLYLAGLCREAGQPARAFAEGSTLGAISMTSYVLGGPATQDAAASENGAATLPDPRAVPPEDTNL